MGGRGSSSGISDKGKKYSTEYRTVYQSGNIKFVKYNDSKSAKTPMETMTNGRVYVTVNDNDELKAITYYDKNNLRSRQIDINSNAHLVNGVYIMPHTHKGYNHSEKGTFALSEKEYKMVDRVKRIWHYYNNKK